MMKTFRTMAITPALAAVLTLVLSLALPALSSAQFPGGAGIGGMGRRGGFNGSGRRMGGPPNGEPAALPTSSDLTKEDPVLVLLTNKSALALSDSQVAQLVSLDAQLVDQNRPLLAEVDSLNATLPARDSSAGRDDRGGQGAGQAGAPTIDQRRAFANVLHQIRENERVALDQSLALLKDDQRGKAEKLLQAQRDKKDKRDSPLRR